MALDALQQLGASAGLNGLLLANLLSCFTQLERDAVHLYRVLADQVDDTTVKGALQDAVKQVMPQEDEHLAWAKSTWQKTLLGALNQR